MLNVEPADSPGRVGRGDPRTSSRWDPGTCTAQEPSTSDSVRDVSPEVCSHTGYASPYSCCLGRWCQRDKFLTWENTCGSLCTADPRDLQPLVGSARSRASGATGWGRGRLRTPPHPWGSQAGSLPSPTLQGSGYEGGLSAFCPSTISLPSV